MKRTATVEPENPVSPSFRVLYITSEMVPYAKTGGLADVSAALPAALAGLGLDVHVVLPLYRSIKEKDCISEAGERTIPVFFGGSDHPTRILTIRPSSRLAVSFIDRDEFFDRSHIYGDGGKDYLDNADRFSFFCRAALKLSSEEDIRPQLLHCNDWQTALIPVYLKAGGGSSVSPETPTLLTIHNLAYQGIFPPAAMTSAGLPMDLFTPEGLEFYGRMNYLKGGLIYADRLNTVSPTYAQEICRPEFGSGLEGVLGARKKDLSGILNGVDYGIWNPATDPHISAPFSPGRLEGKVKCRKDLLQTVGLDPSTKSPVIGMVSRLAGQKGFDILTRAVPALMEMGVNLVILGTGESRFERQLKILARVYQGKMMVRTAFDNSLAHKIEAGADMFLMPSKYEPCGLNQMYSLKYGTIPVVRNTGGLADSIDAFDPKTGLGTGFKFQDYSAEALVRSVAEAAAVYKNMSIWRGLMDKAMTRDFSWTRSAGAYLDLYQRMLEKERYPAEGKGSADDSTE